MSNSGFKNISHNQWGTKVEVQWKRRIRRAFLSAADFPDKTLRTQIGLKIRTEFERDLGKPRTEVKIIGGVKGVRRILPRLGSGGPVWEARLRSEGKLYRRRFAVLKYGEAGARKLAEQARGAMEIEHFGGRLGRNRRRK